MDNVQRAGRAEQALDLHQKLIGDDPEIDFSTALSDLLTDMMHLAKHRGYTHNGAASAVMEAYHMAVINFDAEKRGR